MSGFNVLKGDGSELGLMLRVPVDIYYMILGRITHKIKKKKTNFRPPISPEERLSVTLKYLGSGK